MRAIVFDQSGEPSKVLRVADIPDPIITDRMALVRVAARPIHPADLAFIRGKYRLRPSFPQVAGLEGCGEVVTSPPGSSLRPGTRVAFRYPGAWAELAAVPVDRLIEVPPDIPETVACQASLNPMTALALIAECKAHRGDLILLTAATSGVSRLVSEAARQRGMHTIGLVRGDPDESKSRTAADSIISVHDSDLMKTIADLASSAPISGLLDSVGGPLVGKLMAALAPGATIVAYGVQNSEPAAITNAMLIYSNLTWIGFGIDHWLSQQSPQDKAEIIVEIWSMIRCNAMKLPVDSSHPLTAVADALAADAKGGRFGKVILT